MQALMETVFDIVYLCTVIVIGFYMIRKADGRRQYRMFGVMAVILGCGDAFHLVPRAIGLCTNGLEANAAALGIGKLITSITMTVFYLVLYHIWRERYQVRDRQYLTWTIYGLAVLRILLCLMPANDWLNYHAPLSWGIYRNIPFALMGILIIIMFYMEAKKKADKSFRFMWLAIALSFGFYIPVVLFADAIPLVGMLMIPKTCAYIWVVVMGLQDMKKSR